MTLNMGYKCALAAVAAALTFAGQALALGAGEVRAEIPFAFQAAGKTMRPGRYLIVRAQSRGIVQILGENGDSALMMLEIPAYEAGAGPRLVFEKSAGAPKLLKVVGGAQASRASSR
jgi:hypothetical protein